VIASGADEPRWTRFLPLLLVPVSLLTDLAAALPLRTYFFRDFGSAFYPLNEFAARELREGRFPAWNPYVFEGTFQAPATYPTDLLFALWPSPVFAAWLLTLHLPLAALSAYWLARELGARRPGAFASGSVYALGGLALSCLNLYVFLQALALAPLVAGLLRRAALSGGRAVAAAAAAVAASISTLAIEFVGQACLVGIVLGLLARPARSAVVRLAASLGLGATTAALPLAVTLGFLPETLRGRGFPASESMANAVHPAVLLQTLVPSLFGTPSAPLEAWWGGRFFTMGLPYFLTLYLGPTVLALALVGGRGLPRRERLALLVLGAAGVGYALGEAGGLAPLVARLPFASMFRFPAKALLTPYLAIALAAGFGCDRLAGARDAWRPFALALAGTAAVIALVAAVLAVGPPALVSWSGVDPAQWPRVAATIRKDAASVLGLAAIAGLVALAVARHRARPAAAAVGVALLVVADLARAGAGTNPQVARSFFAPLPELRALGLARPDGGRTFSYPVGRSAAFRSLLAHGRGPRTLGAFFVSRQALAPYSNVLDRVEMPETSDLTSSTPRPPELDLEDLDPGRVDPLLPWLRNAAVVNVLSLDPLSHPELAPLAEVPLGPPGLRLHAYRLSGSWPRSYVACRVVTARSREEALAQPYAPGFDPARDVALEEAGAASCTAGGVERVEAVPGRDRHRVEADGDAWLVSRQSHARGWSARVDGREAPVRRANGKHLAVPVPAGRHEVELRYHPPGLRAGALLSLLGAALVVGVWWRGGSRRITPP
jgi:hypothetical protein